MPAITFSDFSGGLDRRLPIDVQEASRLWELQNAYITLGKRIRKRPCLSLLATGLTNTFGLRAVSGALKVFATRSGTPPTVPAQVQLIQLDDPGLGPTLVGIQYADVVQGYPYVVGRYSLAGVVSYRHHYVDTNPTTPITDTNCPHSASVTKAAARVFAINGETVRYCAAGAARDWTLTSDAGFLPTSLHQDTSASASAVGTYQGSLVVFFSEGAQIWKVAVDPSANEWTKNVSGVGCTSPASLAPFSSDLMFLSPYGFRSMTVQAVSDRIDDVDVGVPVDTLVVPTIPADTTSVFGLWIHQLGQYWAIFPGASTSTVWAYTFSKSSKIACWSRYTFPVVITAVETLNGKVYIRTASSLYEASATQYTDDGTTCDVVAQMAFQNAKTPGVEKQWYGADFVFAGTANVSYLYDPRDQTKETTSQAITGDTVPSVMVPVEVVAASIAPIFRHSANEAFELTQQSIYYNPLLVT